MLGNRTTSAGAPGPCSSTKSSASTRDRPPPLSIRTTACFGSFDSALSSWPTVMIPDIPLAASRGRNLQSLFIETQGGRLLVQHHDLGSLQLAIAVIFVAVRKLDLAIDH